MSDDEPLDTLMARIALGDRAAFERLYRRTSAKLFGVGLRILGDRGEAEDMLQDAYVRVWNNAGQYAAGRASVITWLVAIARNRAIDRLRARKPASVALENAAEIADPAATPEGQAMDVDARSRLDQCLDELDTRDARIIRAAYFGEVSYERVAANEGAPLGTIKSRIRRNLMRLRSCLER